jgi:hypothetical protein
LQKDGGQFGTAGRPKEVATWMKNAHLLTDQDIDRSFVGDWWKWWGGLYPDVEGGGGWEVFDKAGMNSMLIFVLTLAWWGQAISEGGRVSEGPDCWGKAVRDVTQALIKVRAMQHPPVDDPLKSTKAKVMGKSVKLKHGVKRCVAILCVVDGIHPHFTLVGPNLRKLNCLMSNVPPQEPKGTVARTFKLKFALTFNQSPETVGHHCVIHAFAPKDTGI